VVLNDPNTSLKVKHTGTYVIESVHDDGCPGTVVEPRDRFTVTWIDRPKLRLPPSSSTTFRDDVFVRNEVCEGDEDSVEIAFTGQPPFIAEYERLYRPESGSKRQLEKIDNQLTAGLGSASVRLETSKPGLYVYTFTRVSDGLYDDPREAPTESPIILEQTVHPRPSSMFVNPSKVYKYCLDSAAGEDSIIPIQLQGVKNPLSIYNDFC
jgi:nucleoporin POM152